MLLVGLQNDVPSLAVLIGTRSTRVASDMSRRGKTSMHSEVKKAAPKSSVTGRKTRIGAKYMPVRKIS